MTWWWQALSSAFGVVVAGFVAWSVHELRRRHVLRLKQRDDDSWAEIVARSYGVEREPGESVERMQARAREAIERQARYPRTPS